jgi:hypothetical protein
MPDSRTRAWRQARWCALRAKGLSGVECDRRHGTKSGNAIGRPKRIFDRGEVFRLRESGLSIERIAKEMPTLGLPNVLLFV